MEIRISQELPVTRQRGTTLIEFLVSTLISAGLLIGMVQQYSATVRRSYDHKIRIATTLQAQAILQNIGSEIRLLGNGVPFDQPNFDIGDISLSDPSVTEPIQVSTATANHLAFRLNESGDLYMLTADFDTSLGGFVISLTDVSALQPNDPIFISNSVVAGHDGLYGVVASVDSGAKTITLQNGYVTSPGATFAMGSTLEEVPLVVYDSPLDGSGITRDSGYGAVLLGAKSIMTLTYLDEAGNTLALPLTNQMVIDNLRAIRVRVQHTSAKQLIDGSYYTAVVEQAFGIRNLVLVF